MNGTVVFVLLGAYLVVLAWLGVLGMRRTKSLAGFAIGNRDMSPTLVGVAMASSIASTATFVINPGFVYADGLSAFVHYAVAAQGGVIFGLIAVCKGFRRFGDSSGALTIPDWIRHRYGSRAFALAFALVNLLSIAFVVLIVFGCALLLTALTGLPHVPALVVVVLVVFGYVLMGGTYAHAYTNAAQSLMMIVVAVLLFATGWHFFADGQFFARLAAIDPGYGAVVNPGSTLYDSHFAVFVSGFVVTFALMLQPHVLTKVLYLRGERDVRTFLFVAIGTGLVFSLVLFVGFYARLGGLELPAAGQDAVVVQYIAGAFGSGILGEVLRAGVLVALLAAGMSTLDGILVAVSAMVTYDLVLRGREDAALARHALKISRVVVVIVGVVAMALAIEPPALVGIFAQKGVYGLAAASFVPIVFGVLLRGAIPRVPIAIASGSAIAVHFGLHLPGTVPNPAVSACYGILVSVMIGSTLLAVWRRRLSPSCGAH